MNPPRPPHTRPASSAPARWRPEWRRRQRGLGTLAVCAVLLGVLALGAAWAARQLTTAQRVSANDHRAAVAFEVAEAGLAWAVAMLNAGLIDDHCRSASSVGAAAPRDATDFRHRFLQLGADGHFRAPSATSEPPACANIAPLRWSCRCGPGADAGAPSAGIEGTPPSPPDTQEGPRDQPRFTLRFVDAGAPGQLTLIARGCSDRRRDCDDLSEGPVGQAETAQHLALLSALRRPPPTALVEGPDSFSQHFGMPPARYRSQPAVTRLRCRDDCEAVLAQALARGRRLLWIEGDARLARWPEGVLDGTPLVLIVEGRLELSAPGHAQGLLFARDGITWHPPANLGSSWRGALISEGRIDLAKQVTPTHDAAVLYRIHRQMGSYLPVPGGWTSTR